MNRLRRTVQNVAAEIRALLVATVILLGWLPTPVIAGEGRAPEMTRLPGIRNAFQVTPNILAGSQPEGDAAFAALAKAGVKAIISVDGARPDVTAAKKHGLRYVHLPLGYDGIPAQRVAELTKAAQSAEGPVFIHCHHGRHRGPAAAGIICEALEGWSPAKTVAWMRAAGTSHDYPGLYRAAREFVMPAPAALAALGPLPEIAETPDIVGTMVAIDDLLDTLKTLQSAAWESPSEHASRQPPYLAALLREHLRELARTDDTAKRPDEYRRLLKSSEQTAGQLHALLRLEPPPGEKSGTALDELTESCTQCHQAFRNRR